LTFLLVILFRKISNSSKSITPSLSLIWNIFKVSIFTALISE
jgi:hypothetical protein